MNIDDIRLKDRNVGRPFCFLLTLHRKLCRIFRKKPLTDKKSTKILFIKLTELGATILAYQAIKEAIDKAGKKNVFFLASQENRPVLDLLGIIPPSNIIEIASDNLSKFLYSVISAIKKIREEKIDSVVDMEFFSRISASFSYLSGANKRVGFHAFNREAPYRGDLFTHKLIYNPYLHTKVLFLSLIKALDYIPSEDDSPMIFEIPKIKHKKPFFSPSEEDKRKLQKKLATLKKLSLDRSIIVLNPNTNDVLPVRKWAGENYIKLAKMILKDSPKATIVITGTAEEKDNINKIASQIDGAISLAGHTTLRRLLTLFSFSDILITSDSGAAHLATLTNIKSVILFGPETPILYGQTGENSVAISSNLACSPCINVYNFRKSPCRKSQCLKNIKVEKVYKEIKALLR